jgi:hypothetical protein
MDPSPLRSLWSVEWEQDYCVLCKVEDQHALRIVEKPVPKRDGLIEWPCTRLRIAGKGEGCVGAVTCPPDLRPHDSQMGR